MASCQICCTFMAIIITAVLHEAGKAASLPTSSSLPIGSLLPFVCWLPFGERHASFAARLHSSRAAADSPSWASAKAPARTSASTTSCPASRSVPSASPATCALQSLLLFQLQTIAYSHQHYMLLESHSRHQDQSNIISMCINDVQHVLTSMMMEASSGTADPCTVCLSICCDSTDAARRIMRGARLPLPKAGLARGGCPSMGMSDVPAICASPSSLCLMST